MVRPRVSSLAALVVLAGLSACSLRTAACGTQPGPQTAAPGQSPLAKPATSGEPVKLKIAFLGDSVTAGLGLLSAQAYPAVIQSEFATEGYHEVESVNGGITGDTTAGALRRVDQLLEPEVKILVVALGGNDALRGMTAQQTHDNLAAIVEKGLTKGVNVLLVGMLAPPNLGEDYRSAFSAAFVSLATEYKGRIEYIPFLLEGVAGHAELNQDDGIHPNEAGAKIVAETLYPKLRIMVDQIANVGGGL
jgi:acyl-CoA thioesterase-1